MCLLATGLPFLNLLIFGLELEVGFTGCQNFFNEGLLPLLACQTTAVIVGWAFDKGTNLRILWKWVFTSLFPDYTQLESVSGMEKADVGLLKYIQCFLGSRTPRSRKS